MNKVRIGTLFSERSEKVDAIDYPALSVTRNGVVDQLENVAKSNDTSNRKLIRKGDLVLNSRSDRKGSNGLAPRDGSTSLINIVLQPKDSVNPNYMYYYFKSNFFMEENYRIGKGIVADLWSTKYSELKNMEINLPYLEEQNKIANFLYEKVAKIDREIENVKNEMTQNKALHISLINTSLEAVTGEKIRLKYIGNIYGGLTNKNHEDFNENNIGLQSKPYISFSNIFNNFEVKVNPKDKVRIFENEYQNKLMMNDLLFLMSSEGYEDIGKCSIYIQDSIDVYLNSFCKFFRVEKKFIAPKYVAYYLNTTNCRKEIMNRARGFTRINLRQQVLLDLIIKVPPLAIQHELIKELDETTEKLQKRNCILNSKLEALIEYKKVLINDAVTGKIKIGDEYAK